MKIFRTLGASKRELIHFPDGLTALLDGTPRQRSWREVPVKLVTIDGEGNPLLHSECPSPCVSDFLVFRRQAAMRLADFLSTTGELLPLQCPDAELYAWQPLTIVDAVDLAASEVWRFSNGTLMTIRQYVFIREKLEGIDVFKIPDLRVSPIFFSEKAVGVISNAVGDDPQFHLTWSDEKSRTRR